MYEITKKLVMLLCIFRVIVILVNIYKYKL